MYMLIYTNWSHSICFSLYFFVLCNLNKDVKVVISLCTVKYKYLKMHTVLPRSCMCVAAVHPIPYHQQCQLGGYCSFGAALLCLSPASSILEHFYSAPGELQALSPTKLRTDRKRGFVSALVFLNCCIKMHF